MAGGVDAGAGGNVLCSTVGAKDRNAEQLRSMGASDDGGVADDEVKRNLKEQVLDITSEVEEIEKQVSEVNRVRATQRKSKSQSGRTPQSVKERDKEKAGLSSKKQQQVDVSKREAARSRRMAEMMRQLGTILRQITQHKWAWPFMEPVDVKGLGLHDYFEIVKDPMDLGTIRDRMELKDETGYKTVQEICEDIRLVFRNALAYNQDGTDVNVMAKALSERFEEKWKSVIEPKLQEEETKRKQEDREANAKEAAALQAAEEAATEKLASEIGRQLEELDKRLEALKQKATPRCRVMTIDEKRQLGHSLGRLPADNLQRVIQIIAQKNPGFNATADEVEVDIDAQEPATLWRLHRYVQSVANLKAQAAAQKSPPVLEKRDISATENQGAKRGRKAS